MIMRNDRCRDHKDCLVIRVQQDVQDRRAHKECKDHQDHPVNRVNQERMDNQGQ